MVSLEDFKRELEASRAKNTAVTYFTGAKRFLAFLAQKGWAVDTAPAHVLRDFVTYACDDLEPSSRHKYVRAAQLLADFVRSRGVQIASWSTPLLPRVRTPEPTVLRGDRLVEYIEHARKRTEPHRTMLQLLPATALRPNELCHLTRNDITVIKTVKNGHNDTEVWFRVRGVKGQGNAKSLKDRSVPVLFHARPILIHYLVEIRPRLVANNYLFPGRNKNPVAVRTVEAHVAEIAKAMRIDLTPYDLRHTAITYLAEQNVPPEVLRIIAGHTRLEMTQRYIHLSQAAVQRGVAGVTAEFLKR